MRCDESAVRGLRGLPRATDVGVLVAALQLQRQVAPEAEAAQRVADLVGVGADISRPLTHVLDERIEARVQVVDVGDLA